MRHLQVLKVFALHGSFKGSLKFVTAKAKLNLNDNSIHFTGINELRLADSKVILIKKFGQKQDGTVRTLKKCCCRI